MSLSQTRERVTRRRRLAAERAEIAARNSILIPNPQKVAKRRERRKGGLVAQIMRPTGRYDRNPSQPPACYRAAIAPWTPSLIAMEA